MIGSTNEHEKDISYLLNESHVSEWIAPEILNSYEAPPAPMGGVRYRYNFKSNSVEFAGHLKVTSAVSGTVAFVIVQPFWPTYDISFLTDVTAGVGVFAIARIYISSINGDVTVTWPAI
jgi:hypothetical protein